jgi:hypothetical protein
MKKIAALILVGIIACGAALAMTPMREPITLTAGSGTYTNTRDFQVVKPIRFEVYDTQPAVNTQTVSHITGNHTNSIGTIVTSGGAGSLVVTQTLYLFKGDMVEIGGSTNAGDGYLIGEVLP